MSPWAFSSPTSDTSIRAEQRMTAVRSTHPGITALEPWTATPYADGRLRQTRLSERRASACHHHQPVLTLTANTFSDHMPTFRSWLSFAETMMTGRTARCEACEAFTFAALAAMPLLVS